MIERHWGATARANLAEKYILHLREQTFPHLKTLAGFQKAQILRREAAEGVQFLIVTVWDNETAIRAFAGDDPERAVVPDSVREMMIRFDDRATHFRRV